MGTRLHMHSVANAIIVLWGWRRLAVAFAAGAISSLALPPWNAFPVLWLSLPILVWLIDGSIAAENAGRLRRLLPAAIVGWTFGIGYFLAGLWWIGAAFLVDAAKFAWLLPFAVVALPAGLALFWALGAVLARLFWFDGWPRILVFAVSFTIAEWLRGAVLTGFPWNAFGYTLTPAPIMMQSAAIVGLWGLTLAAFVIFAAPALLAASERHGRLGRRVFMGFAAALFLIHLAFGAVRLAGTPDASLTAVHLRIVQPSIDQSEKWQEENRDEIFRRFLQLSDSATSSGSGGIGAFTYLVWPESAFPFFLTDRPDALAALATLLPEGTTLISGAARAERGGVGEPPRIFNSIYVIGDDGEILDAYDKVHLVPFGEFLPFQSALESLGLRQLTDIPGGFSAGPHRRTLTLAGAPPVAPLICYEIIFPDRATEPDSRPGWLLNVTNDAWFGDTPGPRQHFLQARLRAVEEGLPLVRAANSGISAIVDPHGRIVASLGVDEIGVVDGDLPASLPPTVYSRYGGWLLLVSLLVAVAAAAIGQRRFDKRRN
jgi:apolipoprotein N-acyltransferase